MKKSEHHNEGSVDPNPTWDIVTYEEPVDEKLDEWGWERISSGQNKSTGRNDGYYYLSPRTKKRFRSKKQAKLFGLTAKFYDGSENKASEFFKENKNKIKHFSWKHPLNKYTTEYLFSLGWTKVHQRKPDSTALRKWWTHPKCPEKMYSVEAAVNFVEKHNTLFH